jgi:hypothetical protein
MLMVGSGGEVKVDNKHQKDPTNVSIVHSQSLSLTLLPQLIKNDGTWSPPETIWQFTFLDT